MGEKLFTIPVNEAFEKDCECPLCVMVQKLEDNGIDFVMGPSYMEEDVRTDTNMLGFCRPHMKLLLTQKNRLGLALILKTHLDEQLRQAEKLAKKTIKPKSMLKKVPTAEISEWAAKNSSSCYICNRIDTDFPRYIDTVLHLYKKDPAFREKYGKCKGFCQEHFGLLIERAQEKLNQEELNEFYSLTCRLYMENLKRVSDDLEWFAVKFDYRFKNEPWKNSKDAIERGATKANSIVESEKSENL